MPASKRNTLIVANWKMHKTVAEAIQFIAALAPYVETSYPEIFLAVPFTALLEVAKRCRGTKMIVGGQNISEYKEGAFTGEISAQMLREAGAEFVIVGHSERRRFFHETDIIVNNKLKRALESGLNLFYALVNLRRSENKVAQKEPYLRN